MDNAVAKDAVLPCLSRWKPFRWLDKRWPRCPIHVEVPVEVNLDDGVRLRGRIDFLVDTPQGWILLDHKANPRGAPREDALIQKHGQQLDTYADALVRV